MTLQSGRFVAPLLLCLCAPALLAQATPTASRRADLQIGAGFALGDSGYAPGQFHGVTAWADLDLRPHWGAEFAFHQINTPAGDGSYQRTYEIGPRYTRSLGPLAPYLRATYGRGEYNYPYSLTDLSYNIFSGGGGGDFAFGQYLRLRVDYEYQTWTSFPNGGLHPQILTLGAAYHFGGKPRYD